MDRLIALVLLRLRTDFRALTRARERAVGLVLMIPVLIVFSGGASFLVFFGVRSLDRAQPQALIPLLSLAVTAIGLFWALSPLLAGVTFSESYDLSRLLHFPVSLPTLVISSLLANLALGFLLSLGPFLLMAGGGRSLGAAARWLRSSPLVDLSPFAWGVTAAVHAGRGDSCGAPESRYALSHVRQQG